MSLITDVSLELVNYLQWWGSSVELPKHFVWSTVEKGCMLCGEHPYT